MKMKGLKEERELTFSETICTQDALSCDVECSNSQSHQGGFQTRKADYRREKKPCAIHGYISVRILNKIHLYICAF
jgi:hypothetical protein